MSTLRAKNGFAAEKNKLVAEIRSLDLRIGWCCLYDPDNQRTALEQEKECALARLKEICH